MSVVAETPLAHSRSISRTLVWIKVTGLPDPVVVLSPVLVMLRKQMLVLHVDAEDARFGIRVRTINMVNTNAVTGCSCAE